jgi:hypothetical protein
MRDVNNMTSQELRELADKKDKIQKAFPSPEEFSKVYSHVRQIFNKEINIIIDKELPLIFQGHCSLQIRICGVDLAWQEREPLKSLLEECEFIYDSELSVEDKLQFEDVLDIALEKWDLKDELCEVIIENPEYKKLKVEVEAAMTIASRMLDKINFKTKTKKSLENSFYNSAEALQEEEQAFESFLKTLSYEEYYRDLY